MWWRDRKTVTSCDSKVRAMHIMWSQSADRSVAKPLQVATYCKYIDVYLQRFRAFFGRLERKFLEYSFSRTDSFRNESFRKQKFLEVGTFAPEEQKFHSGKSSKKWMFHGTKVPQEWKFSLWTFRSRERKCWGTKSPDNGELAVWIYVLVAFTAGRCYAPCECTADKNGKMVIHRAYPHPPNTWRKM